MDIAGPVRKAWRFLLQILLAISKNRCIIIVAKAVICAVSGVSGAAAGG